MAATRTTQPLFPFATRGAVLGGIVGLMIACYLTVVPNWSGPAAMFGTTITVYAVPDEDGWELYHHPPDDVISYAADIQVQTYTEYARWHSSSPVTRPTVTVTRPTFMREEGPGSQPRPASFFPPTPHKELLAFISADLRTYAGWLGWNQYVPAFGTSTTELGNRIDQGFIVETTLTFAAAGLFLGASAAPFFFERSKRRNLRLGLCPTCGYHKACDLCPECGRTDSRWRHRWVELHTLTSPDSASERPADPESLRRKAASGGRPIAYHRVDRQISPLFGVALMWFAILYAINHLLSTTGPIGALVLVLEWTTGVYVVVVCVLTLIGVHRVSRIQHKLRTTPNACLACLHPIPADTRICPACQHFDNRDDLEPGWKQLTRTRTPPPGATA